MVDTYKSQLEELFAIKNPSLKFGPRFGEEFTAYYQEHVAQKPEWEQGCWIYFPWSKVVTHLLDENDFYTVRTARNKPLMTQQEQDAFYHTTVAIAGLSVGNATALSVVHQGGSRSIKIADFDRLDLSNLNRIRGDIGSLGLSKVEMTARQIYELNPYAKVEVYPEGLTENSLPLFVKGANIIVDAIDDLMWKYRLREQARKYKIPLVSAADLDRSSIIDIERYDLDPKLKYFNGHLGDVHIKDFEGLNKQSAGKMIAKLLGPENQTLRMFSSLSLLGKEILSWPQLGPTASMGGAFLTYVVERIANKKNVKSGRISVSLDEIIDPDYNLVRKKRERKHSINTFKKIFDV